MGQHVRRRLRRAALARDRHQHAAARRSRRRSRSPTASGFRSRQDRPAGRDVLRRLAGPDEEEASACAIPPATAAGARIRRSARPPGESPFEVSVRAFAAHRRPARPLRNGQRAGRVAQDGAAAAALPAAEHRRSDATANVSTGRPARSACSSSARAMPPRAASPTTERTYFQSRARDLVGEQDAGWGQLDVDFVDDRASRRRRRARLRRSRPTHGVDAMTGAMDGAIDPGGGA